jgi:hypothetical protein
MTVYIAVEGIHTKMVAQDLTAKYYEGTPNQYNSANWPTYSSAQGHYLLGYATSSAATCSCTPTTIQNKVSVASTRDPSWITLSGPSCVNIGDIFTVTSSGDWVTSAHGAQWAVNGAINWGCTNAGGCGFKAPTTAGTATVTLRIRGVTGQLNIKVIDPNACTSPTSYTIRDTITWTAPGTDLPGQPINGILSDCESVCTGNKACVGFSRAKGQPDSTPGDCWLKQDISTSYPNDPTWHTYVKA